MKRSLYRAAAIEGESGFLLQNWENAFEFQLTPNKNTILHIAASNNNIIAVKAILKYCSDLLNRVNINGDTPLHSAARGGHVMIVEECIKCAKQSVEGGGVEYAKEIVRRMNEDGDTALHVAVQNNSVDVVKFLVEEDPEFVYEVNKCGESPVYIAAEKGFDECVAAILSTCSFQSHEGPLGRTALHASVIFNSQGSTKRLLDMKQVLTKESDQYGWTPVHYAARFGYVEIVKQMLHIDISLAYLFTDNDDKKTALHIAASAGQVEVVKFFISLCPDCSEMVNRKGQNILHLAVINEKVKVISYLLNNHPCVYMLIDQRDNDGNTPLHLLATSSSNECSGVANDMISASRGGTMVFNKENLNPLDIAFSDKNMRKWPDSIGAKLKKAGGRGQRAVLTRDEEEEELMRSQTLPNVAKDREILAAYTVMSALIATVCFAAAFTFPGGYNDQGLPILAKRSAFKAFIITDTIGMASSAGALVAQLFAFELNDASRVRKHTVIAGGLLLIAVVSMMLAFITGVYVVIAPSLVLVIPVCIIGCSFFIVLCIESRSAAKPNHPSPRKVGRSHVANEQEND